MIQNWKSSTFITLIIDFSFQLVQPKTFFHFAISVFPKFSEHFLQLCLGLWAKKKHPSRFTGKRSWGVQQLLGTAAACVRLTVMRQTKLRRCSKSFMHPRMMIGLDSRRFLMNCGVSIDGADTAAFLRRSIAAADDESRRKSWNLLE